jgi:hypothetical protein
LLWNYPRLRKIKNSLPGPLVELLQKESSRLIQEEPELFALPLKGQRSTQPLEERWFNFIHKMSNRILRGFANHLMDHFSGANLFSLFHTIGSAGGFCTLLAPYFVGFAHHNAQREFARSVMARLGRSLAGENPEACAVFAESFSEAREAAFFVDKAQPPSRGTILTCDRAAGEEAHGFTPIGIYEFSDLPGHRLIYPPVLEMLDYCFRKEIRRLHLVGAGPTGLAGLFIARLLKLPAEATFTDAIPRLARVVTRDGFIEDLAWKYLVWFYNQAQTVFVPSRAVQLDLEERGVAAEKLRRFTPAETDMAALRASRGDGPPAPGELHCPDCRGAA